MKRKEYVINLRNGLKMKVHKHNCSGETHQLHFAYYLGNKKLANFTRISIRGLSEKLKISPTELANFLGYDVSNISVLAHI